MKSAGVGAGLVAGVVVLIWLGTGFFIVQEGQQAVITHFGRYSATVDAGFNWRLPYPIQAPRDRDRHAAALGGRRAQHRGPGHRTARFVDADRGREHRRDPVRRAVPPERRARLPVRERRQTTRWCRPPSRRCARWWARCAWTRRSTRSATRSPRACATRCSPSSTATRSASKSSASTCRGACRPPEQVQAAFDDVLKAGQERERAKNEGQAYANDVIPARRARRRACARKPRATSRAWSPRPRAMRSASSRCWPNTSGRPGHARPPLPGNHAADLQQRDQGDGRVAPGLQPAVPAARQAHAAGGAGARRPPPACRRAGRCRLPPRPPSTPAPRQPRASRESREPRENRR